MEPLDYWRLCDELSIIQAALLVAGVDPGTIQEHIENMSGTNKPAGYEAAKAALCVALRNKAVAGHISEIEERDMNGNYCGTISGTIDLSASRVSVASLCKFLKERGYKEGFFAPREKEAPNYINPKNPHYAPKLAAAVEAWQAIAGNESLLKGKTPKQAIEIWLRKHADKYGLHSTRRTQGAVG